MNARPSRVVVATILGLFFGVVCMLLSRYSAGIAFWPIGVSFLLHHTVMGLAIGTSSLRMHWAAHGAFWGAVFGVFLAISRIGVEPDSWVVFVLVVVWGFLIETLTSKALRRSDSAGQVVANLDKKSFLVQEGVDPSSDGICICRVACNRLIVESVSFGLRNEVMVF